MRTSILTAAILGLFAFGCAGNLTGTGDDNPPGDDVQPGNCGNGVIDSGESCDDNNTTSGDGCSSSCTDETSTVPKLNVSLDKTTVNTELNKDTMITVTLAGEGGFAENVALTGKAVDGTGATLAGWTVTFSQANVAVPNNGSTTSVATVHVPSNSTALTATVKIEAMSSLGMTPADSAFTALNQITFEVTNNNAQCVYPTGPNATLTAHVGVKLRWVNKFTAGAVAGDRITIHIDGNGTGATHEPDPGHLINTAYEDTITAVGTGPVNWYCHAPGPNLATDPQVTIVP